MYDIGCKITTKKGKYTYFCIKTANYSHILFYFFSKRILFAYTLHKKRLFLQQTKTSPSSNFKTSLKTNDDSVQTIHKDKQQYCP